MIDLECGTLTVFDDPTLASVYTMAEACAVWGKSRKTIELRILKGDLKARKPMTGGNILITRASLVRVWGEPKEEKDIVAKALDYDFP